MRLRILSGCHAAAGVPQADEQADDPYRADRQYDTGRQQPEKPYPDRVEDSGIFQQAVRDGDVRVQQPRIFPADRAAPDFVDESRAAVQLVRANLALCRLQGDVVQGESLGYLRTCGKFDLIFLDPPYDTGLLDKALENVVQFDILAEGGIIVCESRREKVLPQLRAPYHLLTERNYGKIKLTLYGKGIHA